MKIAPFILTTLSVICAESYGFVVARDGVEQQEVGFQDDGQLELPDGTLSQIEIGVEAKRSLCIDRHGKQIFGNVGLKTDCSKFVQCAPGVEVISSCQPGLLYNSRKNQCTWARNANCIEYRSKNPGKLVIPESEIPW
ncbi:uncharacterized protein [Euwallacea fornicatus]|uniref:uncharacterized protein n=1 Tax=Euwallacea fornicatus TaxID=995702 RepID=UPI00338D34D2